MNAAEGVARLFSMDDESWRRHANPWSVWTRIAALPFGLLAGWSRVWIGWWFLVPLALVVVWLFLNTRVFPAVSDDGWAARGIYGERMWLEQPELMPTTHRVVLRLLMAVGMVGGAIMIWGVVLLSPWPSVLGLVVLIMGQVWRIDRMGLVYGEVRDRVSLSGAGR